MSLVKLHFYLFNYITNEDHETLNKKKMYVTSPYSLNPLLISTAHASKGLRNTLILSSSETFA